ncbi:MAG: hypothetical protein ACOYL5_20490 [Phototrophicaceae bacterium]
MPMIQSIQQIIKPLEGLAVWGAKLGYGNFVTLEFGREVHEQGLKKTHIHGEWHLWIYSGAWVIESDKQIIAASEDDRPFIQDQIAILNGQALSSVEVYPPSLRTTWYFDGGYRVHIFPIRSEAGESAVDLWLLYTPEDKVLTLTPGVGWSYE